MTRLRAADGTEVPSFAEFEAEYGAFDPARWARLDQRTFLQRCAEEWHGHLESVLGPAQARGGALLASERRAADAALANLERFADAYRAANGAAPTFDRTDGPHMDTTATLAPELRAFTAYLRTGDDAELRAQGVAIGSAGGFLVPQGFRDRVVETMKATGGVRSVAEVITTDSGADMPFPTSNDTANIGAILAENTQATEQDVVLASKTLRAFVYTSKIVRVSLQLLQDAGFPLDPWLAAQLGRRIARAQNAHFTTGTGTAQPEGVHTAAAIGVTLPTGNVTSVTYDGLVELVHSVDPSYREGPGVAWMMADTTFAAIRKLKDTTNRPLVEPDVKSGLPNTLLGYPVIVNQDMPAPAANVKSVLFGNFTAGYVIRDALDFQVLRLAERYADFLQHGYLGWQRSDGLVQDASAIRALSQSAT